MKTVLTLFVSVLLPFLLHAKSEHIKKEAAEKLFQDYSECGSYFLLMGQYLQKTDQVKKAQEYTKAYELSATLAAWAATESGSSNEAAQKALKSSIETHAQKMAKAMKNDYSNASVLIDKYSVRCLSAVQEPEAFIKKESKEVK